MINQQTIDSIKNQIDIVEIVEGFVSLKKQGKYLKGLCPFHNDKSPSFVVTPSKGMYKCFSCGAGGDAIKFIQEHEKLDFIGAIKYLGQQYGVKIEDKPMTDKDKELQQERESIFSALTYAKDFYTSKMLQSSEGKSIGLNYLKKRGFTDKTIQDFGLGYSPQGWSNLLDAAEKLGYKEEILEKAGLITVKDKSKRYDRFRGRVMFPIQSIDGRVVGFTARTLGDDKPKYINSPETKVYHKSKTLYGLFQSKNSIRLEDNCYLVEGQTDVISLHQAGIKNVVASSGTALTVEQIKLIKRFSKNITVIFDGDEAGLKAAVRGIDLILENDLNVKVVVLPEGEDPDGYCKRLGSDKFKEFIEGEAQDFISFKTRLLFKDSSDPTRKAEAITEVLATISRIPDKIKRGVFLQECSKISGIDLTTGQPKTMPRKEPEPAKEVKFLNSEEQFMKVLLQYGSEQDETGKYLYKLMLDDVVGIVLQDKLLREMIFEYKNIAVIDKAPNFEHFLQSPKFAAAAKRIQSRNIKEIQYSSKVDEKSILYMKYNVLKGLCSFEMIQRIKEATTEEEINQEFQMLKMLTEKKNELAASLQLTVTA
jgi:DNA primase